MQQYKKTRPMAGFFVAGGLAFTQPEVFVKRFQINETLRKYFQAA